MPANEAPAHYYFRLLQRELPNESGAPLTTPLMEDFGIDNVGGFFSDVAKRVRESFDVDPNTPHLPGFEPAQPTPEQIAQKERRAVASARSRRGADTLLRLMLSTYEVDNLRSTYRHNKTQEFIPIEPDDTPNSLYLRSLDPIDRLFEAARIKRIVPSAHTRRLGEQAIRTGYDNRDPRFVLPLIVVTGNNTERERRLWLRQLETITEGLRYVPSKAMQEFVLYAASRPEAYIRKPDLLSEVTGLNRKRTSKFRRPA
jgi:hypothetical protein